MAKLARRAKKDLDALPDALAVKAKEIIRRLDQEPHLGKKLHGPLQGKRSARLGRSHRIIYTRKQRSDHRAHDHPQKRRLPLRQGEWFRSVWLTGVDPYQSNHV